MNFNALMLVAGLCLTGVGLVGCGANESDPEAEQLAASIAAGEAVFNENCAECHPRSGRGNYLKRIPADMLTRRSATELMAWIRGRDQHREMPSFTDLEEAGMLALVDYLQAEINR